MHQHVSVQRPVYDQKPLAVSHRPSNEEDEVNECPEPKPSECKQHQQSCTGLPDIESMNPKYPDKPRKQYRNQSRFRTHVCRAHYLAHSLETSTAADANNCIVSDLLSAMRTIHGNHLPHPLRTLDEMSSICQVPRDLACSVLRVKSCDPTHRAAGISLKLLSQCKT